MNLFPTLREQMPGDTSIDVDNFNAMVRAVNMLKGLTFSEEFSTEYGPEGIRVSLGPEAVNSTYTETSRLFRPTITVTPNIPLPGESTTYTISVLLADIVVRNNNTITFASTGEFVSWTSPVSTFPFYGIVYLQISGGGIVLYGSEVSGSDVPSGNDYPICKILVSDPLVGTGTVVVQYQSSTINNYPTVV